MPKKTEKTPRPSKINANLEHANVPSSAQVNQFPCYLTSNQATNSHTIPLIIRLTVGLVQQGLSAAMFADFYFAFPVRRINAIR